MLRITNEALGLMKEMRDQTPDVSEEASVRIQLIASEGQQGLGFGFAEDPIEGDHKVADQEGFEVYLAPELVEPLAEAMIDATATDQGTQLVLREQDVAS